MSRKKTKLCLVCGEEFLGTNGKMTCSGACRTEMSRLLSSGKKPEYWMIVKSKGQKVPNFFKSATKDKKPIEEKNKVIEQKETPTITEPQKKLTPEEYAALEIELKALKSQRLPPGMHPRTFKLLQDDKIADLQAKIDQYRKIVVNNRTNNTPQTNVSINTQLSQSTN